jgi:hypothetical protein
VWTPYILMAYKQSMRLRLGLARPALLIMLTSVLVLAADFTWEWRNQEAIARTAPSLNNTPNLTEAERAALLDVVVKRLQKPLSERGYDEDRIREIASTTRLRFLDLGEDKPAIMATSLGLEGGCDALVNCPFWIFRARKDGYVAILETVAASYTIQPSATGGYSDLVIARHITATENRLTLYKYQEEKYVDAGCYTATFPAPKDGEIQDPEIAPCKAE